jgi:hypothetical protein
VPTASATDDPGAFQPVAVGDVALAEGLFDGRGVLLATYVIDLASADGFLPTFTHIYWHTYENGQADPGLGEALTDAKLYSDPYYETKQVALVVALDDDTLRYRLRSISDTVTDSEWVETKIGFTPSDIELVPFDLPADLCDVGEVYLLQFRAVREGVVAAAAPVPVEYRDTGNPAEEGAYASVGPFETIPESDFGFLLWTQIGTAG